MNRAQMRGLYISSADHDLGLEPHEAMIQYNSEGKQRGAVAEKRRVPCELFARFDRSGNATFLSPTSSEYEGGCGQLQCFEHAVQSCRPRPRP